jgi:hypothetical protein
MRNTCRSLSLAIVLAAACAPAHVVTTPAATPVAGNPIRYAARSDSTELISARLVSLDADSLVFERFVAGHTSGKWETASLPTDSIARLQVRVGRRGNPGRGALIGGLLGAVAGIACASEDPGWLTPTPGECMVSGILGGAGTGLLVGLLIRSDVWAPATLPTGEHEPATPVVSASPVGLGLRIPFRLTGP